MIKVLLISLFLVLYSFSFTSLSYSHCQIPCGIYDDEMRISMIKENIKTIKKSMKEIKKLSKVSKASKVNYNQLIRWVKNKEEHAEKIARIVTFYFMSQRLKPINKKNKVQVLKLSLLHEILFYAMKAKQSTDVGLIKKLSKLTNRFESLYFGKKGGSMFEKLYKEAKVEDGAKLISFEELQSLKASGSDFLLIDVLSEEHYNEHHIEGAISFPLETINKESAEKVLGSNKNIVAYCANFQCSASTMGTKQLRELGYNVLDYKGGLKDYMEQSEE